MKKVFDTAKENLDIVIKNNKLTKENYNKEKALELACRIFDILKPHLEKNIELIKNWKSFDENTHKKYILETFDLLLKNFPSEIKPKIYFKDTFYNTKIPTYSTANACFFANQNKYANKFLPILRNILKEENPIFFAFLDDLNDNGCTGRIVHEFTHYLQFINQSSLSKEIIDKSNEYYDVENKEIYNNSIIEVEAREVGDYINNKIKSILLTRNKQSFRNI